MCPKRYNVAPPSLCVRDINTIPPVTVNLHCAGLRGKMENTIKRKHRQGEVCADVWGFLAFKMRPAASHRER